MPLHHLLLQLGECGVLPPLPLRVSRPNCLSTGRTLLTQKTHTHEIRSNLCWVVLPCYIKPGKMFQFSLHFLIFQILRSFIMQFLKFWTYLFIYNLQQENWIRLEGPNWILVCLFTLTSINLARFGSAHSLHTRNVIPLFLDSVWYCTLQTFIST